MSTLRGTTALLLLSLVASGCPATRSADPLGLENGSMLSGLVPRPGGPARRPGARRGAAAGGDPFIQASPQTAAAQVAASPTGRATLSDAFGGDHEELTSRDTASVAAPSANDRTAEIARVDGRAPQGEAVVQAAMFDSQSASSSMDEADVLQRLQSLEWDLQFTEDHDAQDQLALEIARLRKQLSRSRR
jgi:hypothetical protein